MRALGVDWGVLIAQVVNFGLLLALLSVVLYRPVTRMLRERREQIEKGLAAAAESELRMAQVEADCQKRLEEARREAQAIIEQARETAEKERRAILAQAEAEAQERRERAGNEIERERRAMLRSLRGGVADVAISAASQVLGHAVDSEAHRQLISEFLDQLERAS